MLAFQEESISRPFDSLGFESLYDIGSEDFILEALGANLEYETTDYNFCETESVQSLRYSSSGAPSCSSSPCSSERDYGCERFSSQNIDFDESDTDMHLYCFPKKLKSKSNCKESRKRKHMGKPNSRSNKEGNKWKVELDRVLTCIECRWSELNTEKQQETLELLIDTVSQRLGLREQLQLIQIISPNANVSPNDTEFFIDFELFDDEKFRGVCNFVKQHLKLLNDDSKCNSDNERPNKRSSRRHKESRPASASWNDKNTLEKKVLAKTSKQLRKEKRSGLFKQEEVLLIKEGQANIQDEEELDVVG